MKNNYGSSRKMLLGILVIAGLIICCIGFYRINCSAGVRPFKNLQAEELHYVSYVNGRDSKINLLDPDEYSDFTDVLRRIKAYSVSGKIDYPEGVTRWSFIFERENRKGDMICIKLNQFYEDSSHDTYKGEINYGFLINGKQYRIDQNTYELLEKYEASLR